MDGVIRADGRRSVQRALKYRRMRGDALLPERKRLHAAGGKRAHNNADRGPKRREEI